LKNKIIFSNWLQNLKMYSSIQVLHIVVPIDTFVHMEWCHDQCGWISNFLIVKQNLWISYVR
jgi:hypothetical protein